MIVGAGDGAVVVLAVGARERSTGPDWGGYPVDEVALRHGAGVEEETTEQVGVCAVARRSPHATARAGCPKRASRTAP